METTSESTGIKILKQKCPDCGKGQVFYEKQKLFDFPLMKEHCDVCGYGFRREPGYFFGAMYVSYGLGVLQAISTFLLLYFISGGLSIEWTAAIIITVLFLFAKWNFRLSRVIWIYIFPD
jgi:uncharacterized protein (DUF983 family)